MKTLACVLLLLLAGCNDRPLSWDTILLQRIAQERPDCSATTAVAGKIDVLCGKGPPQSVDVAPIAQFCQRGPRDCEYAIDEVIKALPAPAR